MKNLPVVLLHGFGEDARIWDDFRSGLDGPVLCPDYARRDDLAGIDDYARAVQAEVSAQGHQQYIAVGHSMGGYVALALAELFPQAVAGLCLFHSVASPDSPDKKEQRNQVISLIEQKGAAAFIVTFVENLYGENFPQAHPEVVQQHIDRYADLPVPALTAAVAAMRDRPDRTDVLCNSQRPVLFIIGQDDKAVSPEIAVKQSTLPENGQRLLLEGVGHMGMAEAPEATLAAVKSFVRQVRNTAV